MSHNITRKFWFPLLFTIILSGGVYLGYNIHKNQVLNAHSRVSFNFKSETNPIIETLQLINSYYVENPELHEHYDEVVEKLVSELDPHSYFISAKELSQVHDEMVGSFEGIGIEFYILNDTIQVVSPIPGGPSEQLGIMSGDKIVLVNDTLVAGVNITNDDVLKKLKGPKGTTVKVGIARAAHPEVIDFNIQRDKIPLYSVDAGFKIDDETGYIKVGRFSGPTYQEFMDKLNSLKKQEISQLIIDLRQNPGGFLEEAVKIVSEFLGNKEEIVYLEGRAVKRQSYTSEPLGSFLNGKVAILIDEGSASASEILAGAIQDWDRGVVIGRRSFGKGLVQQQYPLSNGTAVRLTIAKYYTPSGRSIQRPYVKGNTEEYNKDYMQRYEDGEFFVADDNESLVKQDTSNGYYTKVLKRPVFGGGGIAPDYFIPMDTSYLNGLSLEVISGGYIRDYVYDSYNKNPAHFKKYQNARDFYENYQVTETMYQEFLQYCRNSKGSKNTHLNTQEVQQELSLRLKATWAKQLFDNEAFLYVVAQEDRAVQKALEVFKSRDYIFK